MLHASAYLGPFDVRFATRLTRSLKGSRFLVIRDNRSPQSRWLLHFCRTEHTLCLPKHGDFILACLIFSFAHFIGPFPPCLASPVVLSAFKTYVTLRRPRQQWPVIPFLSSASEHYVGAWAPQVGGRALAEGEIPCLRCSMPRRVSVRLMYASSFALPVLSGACGF